MDVFSGVCLFVSLSVNTITSERLNVEHETWRLGAVYKNLAGARLSRSKVKDQSHPGQKKTKKCGILFGSRPLWGAVLRRFHAGGKISACCLVLLTDIVGQDRLKFSQIYTPLKKNEFTGTSLLSRLRRVASKHRDRM